MYSFLMIQRHSLFLEVWEQKGELTVNENLLNINVDNASWKYWTSLKIVK